VPNQWLLGTTVLTQPYYRAGSPMATQQEAVFILFYFYFY